MMRTDVKMRWHNLDNAASAGNESRRRRHVATGVLKLALVTIGLVLGAGTSSRAADDEIRIGNTMPYIGPASADDAYNPQKTVDLTRKLVEEDKVLLIFASLGTAPSAAVRPYLNANKIPQLFVASGAAMG